MARYVLIEFDEDDKADALVRKIEGVESDTYRVAGMYQKPTSYCSCPDTQEHKKHEVGRGKKFGWWVHLICRKPRKGGHQLVNLIKGHERRHAKKIGYVYLAGELGVMDLAAQNIRGDQVDS